MLSVSQQQQQHSRAAAAAAAVRTTRSAVKMSAGDVVCTGWLIKSPPEKKLKRFVSMSTHWALVYVLWQWKEYQFLLMRLVFVYPCVSVLRCGMMI